MRKVFMGASAVFALAAGQANAEVTGYVGGAYTNAEAEIGGVEAEGDGWGLEGAAAFEAAPGVGVQFGAAYADADEGEDAFSANGHLNLRNDKHLFGAFVGASEVLDETFLSVGAEGELYMSNVTLAGAVGYGTVEGVDVLIINDVDVDVWGADAEARFFVTPNFRLEGQLGFANVDVDSFGDDNLLSIGVGAEYQLEQAPISFFGGYSHGELDDLDISTDAFTIGGRWNFGGTLLDRDRSGASLPGLSSLAGALTGL